MKIGQQPGAAALPTESAADDETRTHKHGRQHLHPVLALALVCGHQREQDQERSPEGNPNHRATLVHAEVFSAIHANTVAVSTATPTPRASSSRAKAPLLGLLALLATNQRQGKDRVQVLPAVLVGSGLIISSALGRQRRRASLLADLQRARTPGINP